MFHAGYALERVHIDIMGPLVETQKGNKYILVIVDQFTNQLAETVAGVVVRECVALFGYPLEIHTDQGRNFESELFKEMCELLEIGKQGPQVTDHPLMVKLNNIIDRSHKLLNVVSGICMRDGMILWGYRWVP